MSNKSKKNNNKNINHFANNDAQCVITNDNSNDNNCTLKHDNIEIKLSLPQDLEIVNKIEYKHLLEENIYLKNQVNQLSSNERILQEIKQTHEKTIVELQKENTELKEQLKILELKHADLEIKHADLEIKHADLEIKYYELEVKYDELKEENKQIKEENKQIKEENKQIKEENKQIKEENEQINKKLNKLEINRIINKYIIAIQDLNRLEKLETKVNSVIRLELEDLRNDRVSDCHYLDDNYVNEYFDRRTILYERLVNIPIEVKNEFDILYPNVICGIQSFVAPIMTIPQPRTLSRINRWWNN